MEDFLALFQVNENEFLTLVFDKIHSDEVLSFHLSNPNSEGEYNLPIWVITESYGGIANHWNGLSGISFGQFRNFVDGNLVL